MNVETIFLPLFVTASALLLVVNLVAFFAERADERTRTSSDEATS
jgi:hypothetical protein